MIALTLFKVLMIGGVSYVVICEALHWGGYR
jgi:hypothetical protein